MSSSYQRRGLVGEDVTGPALQTCIEQKHPILELLRQRMGRGKRLDLDMALSVNLHGANTAKGRDVLVLLAHGLAQDLRLDPKGFLSELLGREVLPLEGVQRVQEGHRKTSRAAQARVGRQVSDGDDLQTPVHPDQAHRFADDGVFDVVHRVHDLRLGVTDADTVFEAGIDKDVHVFIDGGADKVAAVATVEGGQIGAAATQRKS